MKNDILLHKWINKTISAEELAIFKLRPEYKSLVDLDEQSSMLTGPDFDSEAMLKTILDAPKSTSSNTEKIKPKSNARKLGWIKYGIAACFLFVAVLWFFPQSNIVEYAISPDKQLNEILPDGSSFNLAGGSKLSFDRSNWTKERKINLKGQSHFDVIKGVPFIVETPNGEVQVLGTEFTVISDNNNLEVLCYEGKVRVSSESSNNYKETLTKGESMFLNDSGKSKTWSSDLTKLRKVTVKEAVDELAKTYNVEIRLNKIDDSELVTCNFQHQNLKLALETTMTPLNIKYRIIEDGSVELTK